MPRQRNDLHSKLVEAWKSKNSGLSDKELQQLFLNGILAVRRCSLSTLSNVTVTLVVERVLSECQGRFPVLSEIKSDSSGFHFNEFNERAHDFKPKDVHEALQELLLELLDAFGKITAEILTRKLHHELMTVTSQTTLEAPPQSEATVSLRLARKNRDQK